VAGNLVGDAFLRSLMDSDGWVSLEKIMTFPRMKKQKLQKLSLPEAMAMGITGRWVLRQCRFYQFLGPARGFHGMFYQTSSRCGLGERKEWWACENEVTYLRVGLQVKVQMRCK